MAKKKGLPEMPATTAEPKTRPVRLDLAQEDHDRLRLRAAKARLSMAAYARMVLMKAIEEEGDE
jgi:plasmid stability protein